jgi:DNA ligase D-like protein (predicted ligase)
LIKKATAKTEYIESMECLPVMTLPEGSEWTFEIKQDGIRLEAIKKVGGIALYSRRRNILNRRFQEVANELQKLPNSTVIDGEIVALDAANRSDFSLLQNLRPGEHKVHYHAFDILILKGRLLTQLPLDERRDILAETLPRGDHIGVSVVERKPAADILKFVEENGLEGVVAKKRDSIYEPGMRSGLWRKKSINQGQEFVIGGYTTDNYGFDALIVGFYLGRDLHFAAIVRAGYLPAIRREVFARIQNLRTAKCPFVNLPELSEGQWGQGLTAEKMRGCVWLKPETVVRIDFREWTTDKLVNSKFISFRDDKDPSEVVREDSRKAD